MLYVAYHRVTTRYLSGHAQVKTLWNAFNSAAAAKAAITREARRGVIRAADFLVTSADTYRSLEAQVPVKNLMSGATVMQSVNTSRACDVSSETYWSQ